MERYYTPNTVAELMIYLISPHSIPDSAIDICAGSWNLLKSSSNRWPDIALTGIDTDEKSEDHLLDGSIFFNTDGRKFALDALRKNQKYPIVLANPPFGSESYKVACLFKDLPGFSEIGYKALVRIETTMLLANLALLQNNGIMAIVLPQTVVNGDWAISIRKYVGNNFYLKKIVFLPDDVFGPDISTGILIIESIQKPNKKGTRVYTAQLLNNKYKLKYNNFISNKLIRQGCWQPVVYANQNNTNFEIKRGQIGNNFLVKTGKHPVIHSTDIENIRKNIQSPTRFCSQDIKVKGYFPHAENGDIVIIRVGRNCGLSAIIGSDIPTLISDCIYVIKAQNLELRNEIFNILASERFVKDLPSLIKGVSAKYLTIKELIGYLNARLGMEGDNRNDYNQATCAGA